MKNHRPSLLLHLGPGWNLQCFNLFYDESQARLGVPSVGAIVSCSSFVHRLEWVDDAARRLLQQGWKGWRS